MIRAIFEHIFELDICKFKYHSVPCNVLLRGPSVAVSGLSSMTITGTTLLTKHCTVGPPVQANHYRNNTSDKTLH